MAHFSTKDIESLYDLNVEKIYRFFYYKFLSKDRAQDLTSQTFLIFVEKAKHSHSIEDPVKYLYGIAKNVFLKELELQYKKGVTISFDETHHDFASYVENLEQKREGKTPEELLKPLIRELTEKQARIIDMRLIQKMSLTEICEALGKNMNYVKTTQKRALKKLKELVTRTL